MGTNKKDQEVKQTPPVEETDESKKINFEEDGHDDFIEHQKRVLQFLTKMQENQQ